MYLCVMKDVRFERFFLSFWPKICAYLKICVAIEGNGNANLYLACVIADLVICVCFVKKLSYVLHQKALF